MRERVYLPAARRTAAVYLEFVRASTDLLSLTQNVQSAGLGEAGHPLAYNAPSSLPAAGNAAEWFGRLVRDGLLTREQVDAVAPEVFAGHAPAR